MINFDNRLDEAITSTMFYKDIPGLAIAITKNDNIVYSKGFGIKSIETKEPVTAKTVFHLASLTKTFVAVSTMQLVEKGIINLKDIIIDYLPYFKIKDERYKRITIEHILTHTSGMPDCEDYEWEYPEYDDEALERYVKSLSELSLLSEPGDKFKYSNIAYEIVGDIISKVSGISFEDYVYWHILHPLRMSDSTLLLQNTTYETLARPHVKDKHKNVALSEVFPYNRKHGPSSTMYSNVLDLSRWAMANINKGILEGERILTDETCCRMWSPKAPIPGEDQSIGLGWFISNHGELKAIGHEGCDIGFRTSFSFIPELKLGITVLANAHYASTRKIMKKAIELFLDEKN